MSPLEQRIGAALERWTRGVCRRPRAVAGAVALVTAALAVYAATHLGFNTDYKLLMSEDVPFRRAWEDFSRHFPTLDDALLVVVDGETPELARRGVEALAARLGTESDLFHDVYVPGSGPFFERNGLLYRSPEELETLIDRVADVQPILAELTVDPTLSNLARLIELGLEQAHDEGTGARDWPGLLDRLGHATVAVYQENPVRVSWEEVLVSGSALDPATRRVLVAEPVLRYDRVLAAAEPIAAVRQAARDLGLVPERGVRVRITGNPALSHEEMLSLLRDVLVAGSASVLAIAVILYLALRSWRITFASLVNLAAGLVWTAAFAALAVGRLNLISIAFAVLFVGLGIDFAIHLGVQYEERRRHGLAHDPALSDAVRSVGSALAICALTTAIGFLAFLPTEFRGVAELGLIAGAGMFFIFGLTLTLFPALLALWVRGKDDWPAADTRSHLTVLAPAERHPRATAAVAVVLAAGALLALPRVSFHSDIVRMRDPDTESVQTFEDLLARSHTTPWQVDILAPDLEHAEAIAEKLRALPEVERAVTLRNYVPEDQEEKILLLEDLAFLLDVPERRTQHESLPVQDQIQALRDLHDFLDQDWLVDSDSPFAASALRLRRRLGEFLERVENDPDPRPELATLEDLLLGGLPDQLDRLRRATHPEPFGLEDLPEALRRRMLAKDGSARVQVFPSENVSDPRSLQAFVDAVQQVAPDATGMATHIVEFSRATAVSLREALAVSLALVAAFLFALWRSPGPVVLAMIPLLLSAALTAASMVVMGTAFNFANVIVIPLLLGMGVDSGIHLVHRGLLTEDRATPAEGLVATHTARAVFYSALTTILSFGSLAFSSHRGLAGLGTLLVVGMGWSLACNLCLLPALIRLYAQRRRAAA